MLRVFGSALVVLGTILCFTVLFSGVGVPIIFAGAALLVVDFYLLQHRDEPELEQALKRSAALRGSSSEATQDAVQRDVCERRITGSMFGR